MPRFVLEIGTEEIPPRYFPVALPHLAEAGKGMLERARLSFDEARVYGTPRRLVFIAENIAAVQAPAVREERGPAAKIAFDAQGKPTKAAEGFARRWGLSPSQLEKRHTDQGEYVFAVIQEPELPAVQALAPLLPGLITGIPFPKAMRWGSGALRFGRPIRWLLALVDEEVVEFELEGIKSGRLTRGHPVLDGGMHEVARAAGYEEELKSRHVIVEPDARRDQMLAEMETIRKAENASVISAGLGMWPWEIPGLTEMLANRELFAQQVAADLAWQTTFSVEWPTPALGRLDSSFLKLPRQVVIQEMQYVQSYFPLDDIAGRLMPAFIATRDGGDDHLDRVVAGWESVLRAKLIDASYFYEQDLKTPLDERVEALKGVVFQEKLGTMYEKMERLREIAAAAGQLWLQPTDREHLSRAACLCKADLTTEVVAELPNLQGVMGGIYAERDGEHQVVRDAIAQHYHPRFAGDSLPIGLGAVLAVCDKLDTVVACFAAGLVPTGSADPMGLRREASGVVRILSDPGGEWVISVKPLLRAGLAALYKQVTLKPSEGEAMQEVMGFLCERLGGQLREEGVRYDLVDAALAVDVDKIGIAARRARALGQLSTTAGFQDTVDACTRPINIAKGFEGGEVDEKLIAEKGESAEKALWQAYRDALAKAEQCNLMELFMLLKDMRPTIARFFDEVLVMHEDEKIRRNRLALCWNINQNLFRRLADFSLIVQT